MAEMDAMKKSLAESEEIPAASITAPKGRSS